MIASLPMYDRPETAGTNDRLWQAIRDDLGFGPTALTRGEDVWEMWQSPDLVVSQTCGFPYRSKLHGRVQMVGTPIYDIDCAPGYYYSVLVVRDDDPRVKPVEFSKARFAYNEPVSQSGWAAPYAFAAEQGFSFSNRIKSGAHLASARMVAEGRADITALDVVSAKMMFRWDRFSEGLRVIAHTRPTPALPLITALGRDVSQISQAVAAAIQGLTTQDREDLCITGLTTLSSAAYLSVPNPPSP